ncbi:glycosyl transferase family 2 [Bacillus pseudomycoides]|uniref:Glycosyl transferase family 2 n=1 Tax=Bacillus pseudomycoides TaxID=64104 RepID=A0AA91VCC1_9BACI|nr:glycosyl transferase family 2 [Bacillus sp. AFS098217]PED82038.1 glycosyl transferase family 2 [Bacillus pseudomycoides]PEU16912.1 glycosyl transferase family 2 [Bacillus sp. AFS019443]PEU20298.1 glycosyl transferase family 2 [Bacillus sp. AFS014408]PFW61400.1 glycosyl transferase family 2 [Bacillus sp. AFS075034]
MYKLWKKTSWNGTLEDLNEGGRVLLERVGVSKKKSILFVMNPIGGGVEYYQNTYIEKNKHKYRIYKMTFRAGIFRIEDINQEIHLYDEFEFHNYDENSFRLLLKSMDIELIYINHLIKFPIFDFIKFIQCSGINYIFFIHDFFCICPLVNLIKRNGPYCNNETDVNICMACLSGGKETDIQTWRKTFESFLSNAQKVIAPSNSTKEIVKKHYPNIAIDVQEHLLSPNIHYTYTPEFASEKKLNVAFVGNMHKNKGSHILYRLKMEIERRKLPVCIKVIGLTDRHKRRFVSPSGHFVVTGPYDNKEISNILAIHKIAIVITSSICPETFSYTTNEAMFSGYPVIAFDMGAPAEQIRKYKGGWILKEVSSQSILQLLQKISINRGEILEKARNLSVACQNKEIL